MVSFLKTVSSGPASDKGPRRADVSDLLQLAASHRCSSSWALRARSAQPRRRHSLSPAGLLQLRVSVQLVRVESIRENKLHVYHTRATAHGNRVHCRSTISHETSASAREGTEVPPGTLPTREGPPAPGNALGVPVPSLPGVTLNSCYTDTLPWTRQLSAVLPLSC